MSGKLLKNASAAALSVMLLTTLYGCQKEGPAERAGKKIDNAAETTGEKIENAGEKIQDKSK